MYFDVFRAHLDAHVDPLNPSLNEADVNAALYRKEQIRNAVAEIKAERAQHSSPAAPASLLRKLRLVISRA